MSDLYVNLVKIRDISIYFLILQNEYTSIYRCLERNAYSIYNKVNLHIVQLKCCDYENIVGASSTKIPPSCCKGLSRKVLESGDLTAIQACYTGPSDANSYINKVTSYVIKTVHPFFKTKLLEINNRLFTFNVSFNVALFEDSD